MPPSSLSAPQQHLLHCWRKHRTPSVWKKKQNKKRQLLSCSAFSLCSPALSITLLTTCNLILFSGVCFCCSLLQPAQRRCVHGICSSLAFANRARGSVLGWDPVSPSDPSAHVVGQAVRKDKGRHSGSLFLSRLVLQSCLHRQPGVSLLVHLLVAVLPLLAHLHSARVDWAAINPLCVHSRHETAGFSEPPVKSCLAEVQKMTPGLQILEAHTGHYMEFLLQDTVKIPV